MKAFIFIALAITCIQWGQVVTCTEPEGTVVKCIHWGQVVSCS